MWNEKWTEGIGGCVLWKGSVRSVAWRRPVSRSYAMVHDVRQRLTDGVRRFHDQMLGSLDFHLNSAHCRLLQPHLRVVLFTRSSSFCCSCVAVSISMSSLLTWWVTAWVWHPVGKSHAAARGSLFRLSLWNLCSDRQFMPSLTIGGKGIMLSGRPSVRPLSYRPLAPVLRDTICLYLVKAS